MSWNRKWTDKDYAGMSQRRFNNVSFTILDREYNRKPEASQKAFWRVCNDAGIDRDDRRVYDLSKVPIPSRIGKPFTRPMMDYIEAHVVIPNGEPMTLNIIAYYTGHDIEEVKGLIRRKRWEKKKENKKGDLGL